MVGYFLLLHCLTTLLSQTLTIVFLGYYQLSLSFFFFPFTNYSLSKRVTYLEGFLSLLLPLPPMSSFSLYLAQSLTI